MFEDEKVEAISCQTLNEVLLSISKVCLFASTAVAIAFTIVAALHSLKILHVLAYHCIICCSTFSSASNKLAESFGINLCNAAINIILESDKDEGVKDSSDYDHSILLSSLSSGEKNTFEKSKFYRTHYKRKSKESSNWWTLFLDPSFKAIYLTEPN